mmetsp:Transcript_28265/g.65148  ORF Transcript_28265/g.65148 Transcript_28265/m.65148 type:complete len:209 (+) Transcript_28265:138-764(+)
MSWTMSSGLAATAARNSDDRLQAAKLSLMNRMQLACSVGALAASALNQSEATLAGARQVLRYSMQSCLRGSSSYLSAQARTSTAIAGDVSTAWSEYIHVRQTWNVSARNSSRRRQPWVLSAQPSWSIALKMRLRLPSTSLCTRNVRPSTIASTSDSAPECSKPRRSRDSACPLRVNRRPRTKQLQYPQLTAVTWTDNPGGSDTFIGIG